MEGKIMIGGQEWKYRPMSKEAANFSGLLSNFETGRVARLPSHLWGNEKGTVFMCDIDIFWLPEDAAVYLIDQYTKTNSNSQEANQKQVPDREELRRYCVDICIGLVQTGLLKEDDLFKKVEEIYAFITK